MSRTQAEQVVMGPDRGDQRQVRPLRVLLVPDMLPWITGTIAYNFARFNPWMEATIVTGEVLQKMLDRFGWFLGEIDVVHLLTEFEADRLMRRFDDRAAVVHSVHHVEEWPFLDAVLECDAVHMVADEWREHLMARGSDPRRLVKVTNGVDTAVFHPASDAQRQRARRKLGIPAGALAVGMFSKRSSNSSGRKAPEIFVAGVQELARRIDNLAVLVVGPGWGDVVEDLRGRGVSCSWVPFAASDAEVSEAYRALDCYWVTSRIEGGPVPLLEAMSSGLCAVTTRVGIAREAVKDGENGYIVPKDDVGAFVARSERLARDAGARRSMGGAARQTIVDHWQWKQVVRGAAELYTTAVENALARKPDLPCATWRMQTQPPSAPNKSRWDYLAAIPRSLRSQVRTLEQVNIIHALQVSGEPKFARRYGYRQLLRRPWVASAWCEIPELCGRPLISRLARRLLSKM